MPRQRIQWYIKVPSAEFKVQYKQSLIWQKASHPINCVLQFDVKLSKKVNALFACMIMPTMATKATFVLLLHCMSYN